LKRNTETDFAPIIKEGNPLNSKKAVISLSTSRVTVRQAGGEADVDIRADGNGPRRRARVEHVRLPAAADSRFGLETIFWAVIRSIRGTVTIGI
jgi:hypothetical protein